MSSSTGNANLFDPAVLVHNLQSLLPPAAPTPSVFNQDERDQGASAEGTTQSAQLNNPNDAIAALAHTFMTAVGFRLVGLGEDHRISTSEGSSSTTTATSSGDAPSNADDVSGTNRLPPEWNARGPESYAFRYRHHQSAMEFVLKLVRMGGRMLIHALAIEDNKTSTLDIQVADYTSASFFPYPKAQASSSSGTSEPLIHGFISSSRVKDLASLFKINIIQKLVPGLQKEGYAEESSGSAHGPAPSSSSSNPNNQQPRAPEYDPLVDPRFQPPQRPGPNYPSYDPFHPGRNPGMIGDRDLDPLGIPPGRFGGGPPPLFGPRGGDDGGGMIVGPGHPLFRDRFGPGGPAGLPPGAVPPGARFDPIGPGGPMRPGGGGGPFGPGQGGGAGGRGGRIGGDPDWDDFAPPRGAGHDDMFG
ncbi:hypothetical protein OC846_000935 [Tilletia horrida]|uniref:Proteasome inhibitor PI31 subunit n=1 Tax=Tilletia horrida TaxID=155126 RepID=A0AAN6GX85_9BASI|nr:hypothetical protein OC845_000845 [Tilletia horrida]KAK0556747.1 hypothetical protein OC846_000935 [Tilletia horrida]